MAQSSILQLQTLQEQPQGQEEKEPQTEGKKE